MAREFAKDFYNSPTWRKCRKGYIAYRKSVDGGMCETCREVPGYIVHHKIWLTPENINNPDVSLNHSNLRYDCLICHNKEIEKENKPKYFFGDDGQIYPVPP